MSIRSTPNPRSFDARDIVTMQLARCPGKETRGLVDFRALALLATPVPYCKSPDVWIGGEDICIKEGAEWTD
jgi:hypothetical protein